MVKYQLVYHSEQGIYQIRTGKIPLSEYHAAVGKKPIVTWYFTMPEMVFYRLWIGILLVHTWYNIE